MAFAEFFYPLAFQANEARVGNFSVLQPKQAVPRSTPPDHLSSDPVLPHLLQESVFNSFRIERCRNSHQRHYARIFAELIRQTGFPCQLVIALYRGTKPSQNSTTFFCIYTRRLHTQHRLPLTHAANAPYPDHMLF